DLLVDRDDDVARRTGAAERFPQSSGRPPHQIGLVERHAGLPAFHGEGTATLDQRQRVVQLDRLKDRAQLVKAVHPGPEDAQIEIDLGVGAGDKPAGRTRHDAPSGPALRSSSNVNGTASFGTSTLNTAFSSGTFASRWETRIVRSAAATFGDAVV